MLYTEECEKIVKRFSPTTKLIIEDRPGQEGIYMGKTNEIIITKDWNIAGLLHELTHARLYLANIEDKHGRHFADELTKVVAIYLDEFTDKKII
jgi:hypothetical protein